MRLIRNLGILLIVLLVCNSCFKAPEYPVEPQISFNDIYFGAAKKSTQTDSIVLSLNFKDGDGDLGLSDDDSSNFTYINGYYFIIKNNQVLFADKPDYTITNGSYVNYKMKRANPTLTVPDATTVTDWNANNIVTTKTVAVPDFIPPYSCTNWVTTTNSAGNVIDTVYVQYNPNYFNIYIDFAFKNSDGTTTAFDPTTYFEYPNCSVSGFNGRFPVLSKDLSKASPLDGVIHYTMKSSAFKFLFSTKTVQITASIRDRALHQSLPVTYEFNLQNITRK